MTKQELNKILFEIKYAERFYDNFWVREYKTGYEDREDKKNQKPTPNKKFPIKNYKCFSSIEYRFPIPKGKDSYVDYKNCINNWFSFFRTLDGRSELEIFKVCVQIIDWGGIAGRTNDLYQLNELAEKNELKKLLMNVKDIFANHHNDIDTNNIKVKYFSSGFTKIYSFVNPSIIIYDSRFQAFLNHTLTFNSKNNQNQIEQITSYLFNANDLGKRKRKIEDWKFSNKNKNSVDGFRANILASWCIQYLHDSQNYDTKLAFKDFDEKFFMLGFDLNYLNI